jgi:hypothetical protein
MDQTQIGKRFGNIEDLPVELRKQIVLAYQKPTFASQAIEAINSFGGVASTDEILVFFYRKTKKVHSRGYVESNLYMAAKSGRIEKRRLSEKNSNRRRGEINLLWATKPDF